MGHLEEVELKHSQLRSLLEKHQADALWLRRTTNVAWVTGGADATISVESSYGVFSIVITPERRLVYADNIEMPRLRAEENLEAQGFELVEYPWYQSASPEYKHLITDEGEIDSEVQKLRMVLTTYEIERLRGLGFDAARALEFAVANVKPGDTEQQIAGRLAAACRERGGMAIVNLVASDERIAQFRHPLPTGKQIEKLVMAVVCLRREGLIAAATRFAHIGAIPGALAEKVQKVAYIDAAVIEATRPGRTLGDVFADLQAAYAARGEADQWQQHHQGGSIAYASRERVAQPGDPTLIQTNQAFAWNPSIVGCKSEDTILLHNDDFEIITATGNEAQIPVEINGRIINRPGIIEL